MEVNGVEAQQFIEPIGGSERHSEVKEHVQIQDERNTIPSKQNVVN